MRFHASHPAPAFWGRIFFIAFVALTLAVPTAEAQGKGRKVGQQRISTPAATTGSAAPLAAVSSPSTLQFGSWLDDASVLAPGSAWASMSFGHYRLSGSNQTDFPVVDAGLGLADRVQFGLTVPYYRVQVPGTPAFGGIGDVYVNAKISLINPVASGGNFGLALTPVAEVLEQPNSGSSRVTFGLPVDLEYRLNGYRLYGSTGVFSRGAIFGGGAVEKAVNDKVVVTGALTFTRSLKEDLAAQAIGIPRSRSDVTAMATYFLTPSIAAFAGTGRTLGSNPSATSFMLNGGVSFSFASRTN
jgi:hypothetical protein